MSTSPLVVDYGAIAAFAGAAFPVAFADPAAAAIRQIKAADACTAWAKVVTDAATNFTSIDVEIVDSYSGASGSWVPNVVVASSSLGTLTYGVGTNNTTVNVTVTSAHTYWIKLQTANTQMGIGGASIIVRANGGAAKSGDSVTLYLATTEGV